MQAAAKIALSSTTVPAFPRPADAMDSAVVEAEAACAVSTARHELVLLVVLEVEVDRDSQDWSWRANDLRGLWSCRRACLRLQWEVGL